MTVKETHYICKICKKTFAGPQTLKIHERVHEDLNKPFDQPENFNYKPQEYEKLFEPNNDGQWECKICDKMYGTKLKLKIHDRIHGERNFPCDKCQKSFYDTSALKRHYRLHTGMPITNIILWKHNL